jgi:hypothetical protein
MAGLSLREAFIARVADGARVQSLYYDLKPRIKHRYASFFIVLCIAGDEGQAVAQGGGTNDQIRL